MLQLLLGNNIEICLVGGTAPIDLNGINPVGVDEAGTSLSKANLLSDATVTALGLDPVDDPTVDDAFGIFCL